MNDHATAALMRIETALRHLFGVLVWGFASIMLGIAALVVLLLARIANAQESGVTPGTAGALPFAATSTPGVAPTLFADRPSGLAVLDNEGNGRAEFAVPVAPWALVSGGESFRRWDHDTGTLGATLALALVPRIGVQVRATLTLGSSFRAGSTLTGESAVAFGFADGDRWHGGWGWIVAGKRHNSDWFAGVSAGYRDGFDGDAGAIGWRASFVLECRFGRNFAGGVLGDYGTLTDGPSPALDAITAALTIGIEWRPAAPVVVVVGASFDLPRVIRRGRRPSGGENPADAFSSAFRAAGDGLTAFAGFEFRG